MSAAVVLRWLIVSDQHRRTHERRKSCVDGFRRVTCRKCAEYGSRDGGKTGNLFAVLSAEMEALNRNDERGSNSTPSDA